MRLTEARAVGSQLIRQGFLLDCPVDEPADHGVLGCTDQIQIFAFDLVHHVFHFLEAHDALDDFAMDHERRQEVCEAFIDHEVTGIGQDGGVQSGNITAQEVETVAGCVAGAVQINAVQAFHDINMVRNFPFRNNRITELLNFNVLGVIVADRNSRVNDVRDDHHAVLDFFFEFSFLGFQGFQFSTIFLNLGLDLFGFFLQAFAHQAADFLGEFVALASQSVRSCLGFAEFLVELRHFINEDQLFILELLSDVFFDEFRVFSNQFNVNHFNFPPGYKNTVTAVRDDVIFAVPPYLPDCFT